MHDFKFTVPAVPFHISRPQRHAFCGEGTAWNAIKEDCCFPVGQVARPHSTAHPSGTASQSRREGGKVRVRDTWLHIFSLADSSRRFWSRGQSRGFPREPATVRLDNYFLKNSLKCQLCSEVCSLLHDTILEEEGRKGQHCMTDVLVP